MAQVEPTAPPAEPEPTTKQDDYYNEEEGKRYADPRSYYDMTYNDPYYYNYGRFGFGMGMGSYGSGFGMNYGYGNSGYGGWNDPYWNNSWQSGYGAWGYNGWNNGFGGYGGYGTLAVLRLWHLLGLYRLEHWLGWWSLLRVWRELLWVLSADRHRGRRGGSGTVVGHRPGISSGRPGSGVAV
ncbi:MAG: hypothetical protein IPH53_02520 [Flavobacteriales bacterium]|nr:hypothetical protein [Flavobacteriales bacterium]